MKKLLIGLLILGSMPSYAHNKISSFLVRRNLFKLATIPEEADLNLNEYMNCISYDFRNKKKVALAAIFFKKVNDGIYIDNGLGNSIFNKSEYKMEAKQLSASVKDGEDIHMISFRVTNTGVLLFEVATTHKYDSAKNNFKAVIDKDYESFTYGYGACEFNYSVDVGHIDDYKILEK